MKENSIFQHEAFNGRFFLTRPGKCDYLNLRSNYRHQPDALPAEAEIENEMSEEEDREFRAANGRGYAYSGDDHADELMHTQTHAAHVLASSIQQEALNRIEQCLGIMPGNIEVAYFDSCIILKGSVLDRETKRAAEDAVAEIPGVHDVINKLRVAPLFTDPAGSVSDG